MKDIAETRSRLKGLFNITTTPFARDGAFDGNALAENIERVIELGYDGVLIGGTYGEFATMTTDERAILFRRAIDVVGDRLPVMLCTAHADSRTVSELTQLAGELGGLPMITAPYVSEVTDDQIVAFFREMAPLSRTGVLIYNAPGIGINLPASLMERIAEDERIVGIKQGDLNPTTVDILAYRLKGRLKLFCASDLAFLGPMMVGFDGLSSTNSGALPEIILRSFRAVVAGDATTARDLHGSWYAYRELARLFGQPQTVKAAMAVRGFRGGSVRRPLLDLECQALDQIASVIGALQLGSDGLPMRKAA